MKLNVMTIVDDKGKKVRGLALMEDITQKKAIFHQVEEAGNRLQMILEEIQEYGILSADRDMVITYFGPGCERLFGWKAQEVVGKKTPTS